MHVRGFSTIMFDAAQFPGGSVFIYREVWELAWDV
jgi:hypothetical protein